MPRIGIHTSIAVSLAHAAERAAQIGCNALQIFSSSPRMWRASRLDPGNVRAFLAAREKHGLQPLVIHDNYLINLPSADPAIRLQSIQSFRGELERALALRADFLVLHPGSHRGQPVEQAIDLFAGSLAEAARGLKLDGLRLLLENTAGGGFTMGRSPQELLALREAVWKRADLPVGFCLDTAHCFQAGLDFFDVFRALPAADVPVLHSNDSKTAFGSRHDRHEQIGKGELGREGLRRILRHPRLRGKTFILETPVVRPDDDRRNVRALKALLETR